MAEENEVEKEVEPLPAPPANNGTPPMMPKKTTSPNGTPTKTPLTNPFAKISPVAAASPQQTYAYPVVPVVSTETPPPPPPKSAVTTSTAASAQKTSASAYPVVPVVSTAVTAPPPAKATVAVAATAVPGGEPRATERKRVGVTIFPIHSR